MNITIDKPLHELSDDDLETLLNDLQEEQKLIYTELRRRRMDD